MAAEIYPPSLAGSVCYAHAQTNRPILVTEHGATTADDGLRSWFIPAALGELRQVIDDGVAIPVYMHWSLVDSFEWIFGYHNTFGLHSLNRQTCARTPKPSAAVYAAIARAIAA